MSEKYAFIDAERATVDENGDRKYPVVKMCAWLEVSTSGYYEWAGRPVSATQSRRDQLRLLVRTSFEASDSTYGHRRVQADLVRSGYVAHPEVVRELMREMDLVPCQPRPFRPTTTIGDEGAPAIPDLVGRDFTAAAPGEKLVGDITYIRCDEGWLYLASVIDCCTKSVFGYAMAEHMRDDLVISAMDMAARNHNLPDRGVFHSDRGSQYTSADFAKTLKQYGLDQSVGRTGICYDNAMAESFNGVLKVERVHRQQYRTREQARADIARYIELRYNSRRIHSGLGYRTPAEVYAEHLNQPLVA